MFRTRFPLAVLTLSALATLACSRRDDAVADSLAADSAAAALTPPPPAMVSVIETGKHIDINTKRIVDTTSTFAPRDTLFVSVQTNNSTSTTTLKAVVTFQDGQVVDSTSQAVAMPVTTGTPAVTEFHWTKPGGWPVGDYTVEVWLDGQSAGTRTISVKR
jgi:hypothetical protein